MFEKWGHFAYRHRVAVPIVVIGFIVGLFALFGTQLGALMSQEGWDDPGSSSTKAAAIEQEVFGRDNGGDVVIVYTAPEGRTVDDPAIVGPAQRHLDQLAASNPDTIDHVTSYFEKRTPMLATQDKHMAFAAIGLKGDGEDVLKNFRAVEDQLVDPDLEATGVVQQVAGQTAIADALDDGMSGDIHRAEIYALPAVGLLLLIVFGSLVAATMPLIVGVLSILGSLGVLALLAHVAQVNVFAQSVVTLLGLGLAIDYGLFLVSRFREELDAGHDVRQATITATATAGKTVVFSAAMVAVALSGLLLFPQAFLKSVAYGAISAVGLAALLSITVLPSIFALLGHKIDKFALRRKPLTQERIENSVWARIPDWAMRHSGIVTTVIVAGLIALAVPLGGVKFGGINETYLPPGDEVRAAQHTFDENFPQFRTDPIKVVITGADNQQIVDIYRQLNEVQGITGRFAPSQPAKDETTVMAAGIIDREDNKAVVHQLREITVPEGVNMYIGGSPALEVESIEALFHTLPWMALYIVVATFILLSLVFGSVILPAKAIIMTILGMGATLGVLTAMFVDGFGADLLNFTPGPLMSPVLVLIMAIIYGLSTDYEVFLLSRMVEARDRGKSTDEAIRIGTSHTGNIITAAAIIMIVVCGAFGFSTIVMMKYIAYGMIVALILDATIIRMLLVPAVMHMLKEDNWWAPRFVKKASLVLGHNAPDNSLMHTPVVPAVAGAPAVEASEASTGPAGGAESVAGAADAGLAVDSPEHSPAAVTPADPADPEFPADSPAPAAPVEDDVVSADPADADDQVDAAADLEGGVDGDSVLEMDEPVVDEVDIIADNEAKRAGRSTTEDTQLIPFAELLRRLEEDDNNE
ncbi:MMPL family transporter [Corynebacterium aquilae]|uniref:RND transporter n=1 Tax=Corynebacterium aquilae DSM 44791 TaxID=1431546 RepID=A0A1L7CIB2_9CORY|nr:MMPL family transporter [Corynebacterium aquilae]APT85602.1 RND transporter [Corynebacterium aquilae DSM 44791]